MSLGGAKYLKYSFAEAPSAEVEGIGGIIRTPLQKKTPEQVETLRNYIMGHH